MHHVCIGDEYAQVACLRVQRVREVAAFTLLVPLCQLQGKEERDGIRSVIAL